MRSRIALVCVALLVCVVSCATVSRDMKLNEDGYSYLQKGDYKKAEPYFKDALAANPKNAYAMLNLGVVYQHTDRPDLARKAYMKVIEMNPKDVPQKVTEDGNRGKSLVDIAKANLSLLK